MCIIIAIENILVSSILSMIEMLMSCTTGITQPAVSKSLNEETDHHGDCEQSLFFLFNLNKLDKSLQEIEEFIVHGM